MRKTLDLKMPASWDELTAAQLLFVCRLFLQNLSEHEFRLRVFLKFTGTRALPQRVIAEHVYYFFRHGKTRFSLTVDELHWFLQSANFLLSEVQLNHNHLPVIRLFGLNFHGPRAKGYNISYLEYVHAEAAVFAWHKTQKPEHLQKLCAILYRPSVKSKVYYSPDWNGDPRIPFNDFAFQRRARFFRLIPKAKLMAVYLFYQGLKNALAKAHPGVFSKVTVSSEPANPVESLKQIVFELNGGDITRNAEITRKPVWEIFDQLEHNARVNTETARLLKRSK
jgi:hypothetical protein